MKNKLTKTKFNSTLGIACHLFSGAACLGGSHSDLLQRVRTELAGVGKGFPRRRDL